MRDDYDGIFSIFFYFLMKNSYNHPKIWIPSKNRKSNRISNQIIGLIFQLFINLVVLFNYFSVLLSTHL